MWLGYVRPLSRYRSSFLKEESSAARPVMSTVDPGLVRPQFLDGRTMSLDLSLLELGGFGIAMVSNCVQVRHPSHLRKSTGAVSVRWSWQARTTLQALPQVPQRTAGPARLNGSNGSPKSRADASLGEGMNRNDQFVHCSCFLSWLLDAFCGQSEHH